MIRVVQNGALALCVLLGFVVSSCGGGDFGLSSPERLSSSILRIHRELASEESGRVRADSFLRAVYRLTNPVSFSPPPDRFETTGPLPVVTDRDEPELGGAEFMAKIWNGDRDRLRGLSPTMVVARYTGEDRRALDEQQGWIRGWRQRYRQESERASFDEEHRKSLLKRLVVSDAQYEWVRGGESYPVISFNFFNPLDVALSTLNLVIDVVDGGGRVVASGRVGHSPEYPLAAGVRTRVTIPVSSVPGLSGEELSRVRGRIGAKVAIENVLVDGLDPLVPVRKRDPQGDLRRERMVADLEVRIRTARENLMRYRVLFP